METYDPDLIPTPEFKILHTFVTDPDASAPNAVQQILNLTTTELSPKNDMPRNQFESNVAWNIGVLTIDIAANTASAQQTKLLDFISQLQKVTVTDPRTGEMIKYGNFGYLWTDLPSLGMHAADNCNFFNHASHTPDELSKWENKIAFIAQSTAAAEITYNSEPTHTMDFSIYGLYACRDAFEEGQRYETAVRTACIWFIYAAEALLENCRNNRVYALHDPPKRGFDLHRWCSWKLGLVEAKTRYEDEGTRGLIGAALARMNQVDAKN